MARLAVRLEDAPVVPFDWSTAPRHCREAWLRGRFLAAGSLSVGEGGAHLELSDAPAAASALAGHLGAMGLGASSRVRRGRGVVTIGGPTTSSRCSGSSAPRPRCSTSRRGWSRQLEGHLNRVINAEGANLHRSVRAAHRLAAVETLEADGRLATLPPQVREVAAARREAPEASLSLSWPG
ncbi:MAG: helix-turn-helix domain-containing protein [Chloroflexota bacterium]